MFFRNICDGEHCFIQNIPFHVASSLLYISNGYCWKTCVLDKFPTSYFFYGVIAEELAGPGNFFEFYIRENLRVELVETLHYSSRHISYCCWCGKKRASKLITSTNEYQMCSDCRKNEEKPVQRQKTSKKSESFEQWALKVVFSLILKCF